MERADLLYSGLMFAAGMLVPVDRIAADCHLRCPRTLAPKIRTPGCYNFIYKTSSLFTPLFFTPWCRRTYAPSFPT